MAYSYKGVNVPVPGSRLPAFYINGFTVALDGTTPDSKLTLSSGSCADSTDNIDMVIETATTLDAGTIGVNGMDASVLGNNLFYYIHVIGDSSGFNAPAGLISLSATAPTLPAGYDSFRMVDIKLTDGTADFLVTYTEGTNNSRKFIHDAPKKVLDAAGSATFAAINLTAAGTTTSVAPVLKPMVQFTVQVLPDSAADSITLIPGDSDSTAYAVFSGSVASVLESGDIECLAIVSSGAAKVEYKTTDADVDATLYVKSFTYYV